MLTNRQHPNRVIAQALLLCLALALSLDSVISVQAQSNPLRQTDTPLNIAHRGASAYAPEHTAAAYRMAIEMGAPFIEPDLQMTRDGVLIALHDPTLERTTNVATLFPQRYRRVQRGAKAVRQWFAYDFSLAEIKQLDAGSWLSEAYAGERILTLDEVIALAQGKADIMPELKYPDRYLAQGLDMAQAFWHVLERHRLTRGEHGPQVVVQSFHFDTLVRLRQQFQSSLPQVFLVYGDSAAPWLSDEGLARVATIADALGPSKLLIEADPTLVSRSHQQGLAVIPYTFASPHRATDAALIREMQTALCLWQVDGLFTNNPDLFGQVGPCRDESNAPVATP
ncbi:glycerophosphodiester phosphodiesterase family protein [Ferrimonas marina]|nr:glycerophosphodiester phosphodiesterase family protein [Ferrimonas marina]